VDTDSRERDAESDATATGFLTETVATIATGGSIDAARAPSQERIKETPDRFQLVGENPTRAFTSGDEETRDAIRETQDLLGLDPAPDERDRRRRGRRRDDEPEPLLQFDDKRDNDNRRRESEPFLDFEGGELL